MSVLHSQKDPLEYDTCKEIHISGIDLTERRCSPLKLCSHAAVARRSRRQFTCLTEDLDDQSSSIWRFLSWVAYSRTFAGRNQITDDERLRCPLIWCRQVLGDQNMLLKHVFTCAHLSDGRYWCYHCQKEENFDPFQCKHCQVPAFGKERLSVRVKRLLRSLGTKSHLKDHQAFNPSATPKGASCAIRSRFLEYQPDHHDIAPTVVEVENSQILRDQPVWHDLEKDPKSTLSELNGSNFLPAELSGSLASTSKLDDPSLRSKTIRYSMNNEGTASALHYTSMDAIQAQVLPTLSCDYLETPSRPHLKINEPSTSKTSLPQLQSPVFPQTAPWMSVCYTDTISASPTNTDFTGISLFTPSFASEISPPSTRNSTMQSFSQSSLTAESPSEGPLTLPVTHDIMNEMPNSIPEEGFTCAGLASNILADTFHSTERQVSTCIGSPHWLTPKDLLNDFWKVLTLHVKESSERLNMLPDSPVTSHLLSMTADTIAFTGFSAWQGTLNGYLPSTIPDLYALLHTAYACAIVIYDGQVENRLEHLFTHSLSIDTGALSDEDQTIYTSIVWSIWAPGMEDLHLQPLTSTEHSNLPVQTQNGQSMVKGKAPAQLLRVSGQVTQPLRAELAANIAESYTYKDNEIFHVLAHFVDIFEGTTFCDETPPVVRNLSYTPRDEKFIRTIKENVTIPLIKGYFQPGPSLEGFIKAVLKIDRLVSVGQITTVRGVEVGLKWAGRSTAQSMELYGIFSSRVENLCSGVYHQLPQDLILQSESHVEGINAICIHLEMIISEAKQQNPGEEHGHEACIQSSNSSISLEQQCSRLDGIVDDPAAEGLSYSNIIQAELFRRSAIKRKRPSSSSSASTPETGPSPSSSASSNTLSDSLENEYSRCSRCGFRPTGERKWHKRTMRRHMLTHIDPDHKEAYPCNSQGCGSSFTRADNLAQHVRMVHQRKKRQCSSKVSLGIGGVKPPPKSNGRSGS